jgi:hypothetical protein
MRVRNEDFAAEVKKAFADGCVVSKDGVAHTLGVTANFFSVRGGVSPVAYPFSLGFDVQPTVAEAVTAVEARFSEALARYRGMLRSKGWRPGPPPKDGKLYPVCLHGGEGFGLAAYSSLMGEWMTGYEDAEWASEDVFRYHWPDPISTPPGEEDLQSSLSKERAP